MTKYLINKTSTNTFIVDITLNNEIVCAIFVDHIANVDENVAVFMTKQNDPIAIVAAKEIEYIENGVYL